jgi:hypothetical protein
MSVTPVEASAPRRTPSALVVPRREVVALTAFFVLVAVIYAWIVQTSIEGLTFKPEFKGAYGTLADAFVHGQLNLRVSPPDGLLALSDPYDPRVVGGVGRGARGGFDLAVALGRGVVGPLSRRSRPADVRAARPSRCVRPTVDVLQRCALRLPFELGSKYQLAGVNQADYAPFTFAFLKPGLFYYLLGPPRLEPLFPFVALGPPPLFPGDLPQGYVKSEPTAGLLPTTPFLVILALLPVAARRWNRRLRAVPSRSSGCAWRSCCSPPARCGRRPSGMSWTS